MEPSNISNLEIPPSRTVILSELGPTLPIGILGQDGKTLQKDFSYRPWRMKEEREIGSLREKNPQANMGQYVAMKLAVMVKKVGPHNFDDLTKESDKRVIIGQMFMPDVFYLYLYLRRSSVGKTLETRPTCPNCSHTFDYYGDLDSLEVKVVDDLESSKWTYDLEVPITIRKQPVSQLVMGPPRWNAFESMPGGTNSWLNTGSAKSSMILASIYSVEHHGEVVLAEHEIEDLCKRDLEILSRQIDLRSPGPKMTLDVVCPKCSSEFNRAIEWASEDFFSISGQ